NPRQIDVRGVLLGRPAADGGEVDDAEAPQVPVQACGEITPRAKIAERRVLTAPEAGPRVGDRQAGDEWTELRLLQPQHRGLHDLAGLRQLGAVPPAM